MRDIRLAVNLIEVLEEMMSYHGKLYHLLKKEKEVMLKGSIEDLEECIKEKETITLKLKILDDIRCGINKKISDSFGIDEKSLTVSKLSSMLGGDYEKGLKRISYKLKLLIADINVLNNQNRVFIESFMSHIRLALSFTNRVNPEEVIYQKNGVTKDVGDISRVLCKV